jgi:CRISPR-associated Csx2 family protein
MRKIITFLGIRPQETTYLYNGQPYKGRVFAEALRQFETYDQMLVCATEKAHQEVWPILAALNDERIIEVQIKDGKSTEEDWEIFDQIIGHVQNQDTVIFDITHGLRSLPFLIFLFAAYLKTARNVDIAAIYYGALELGNFKENKPAPVLNLTEFVAMLDWLTATERFNRTGDARDLAGLLKKLRAQLGKQYQSDPSQSEGVGRLGNLAGALTDISQALRLIRPNHAMQKIAGLEERIQKARPMLDQTPSARPFALLLDSVAQTYRSLAHDTPDHPAQARQVLAIERTMIHWYAEREQWVQAVSLAREWLLSWIMVMLDLNQLNNLDLREKIERVVGAEANEYRNADANDQTFTSVFLKSVPQIDKVLSLWLSLTKVRNDIDHAGKRENPEEPKSLIANIQKLIQRLDDLEI